MRGVSSKAELGRGVRCKVHSYWGQMGLGKKSKNVSMDVVGKCVSVLYDSITKDHMEIVNHK